MKYTLPIIALLLGYIIFLHSCHLPDIEKSIETTAKQHTEVVDSLGKEISYWKSVPPDTIRDTIDVPVPKIVYVNGDTLNEYSSSYTDSLIVARWTQQIAGELKSQEFEYMLKKQQIVERTRYRTKTVTLERTTTITNTIEPSGYLSFGGFAGHLNDEIVYGPSLSYTTNRQQTFFVNYHVPQQGFTAGLRWRLNFSLNPFK